LLIEDGNLTARYSYRVLNSTTLNLIDQLSVQYVNGVGLVYQRDFDTFGEFFRNILRKNGHKAITPAPIPTKTPTNTDTPVITEKSENDDQ
jgi:hypothetical protein